MQLVKTPHDIPNLFISPLTIPGKDIDFAVWSGFELGVATLSACVPTMRPLLDCVCGRRASTKAKESSGFRVCRRQKLGSPCFAPVSPLVADVHFPQTENTATTKLSELSDREIL